MPDISLRLDAAALGTDAYGDLAVHNGDLLLTRDTAQGAVAGADPIAQSVVQKMRTLLGEFFLDTSLGVPYYQELLGKRQQTIGFETALQKVITSTPGVVALLSWKLEAKPQQRRLEVSFRAQTTTGQVVWSGSLNPQPGGGY